ncbi:conserved hypothetical tiny transmembrane protein [Evansella caseinilytica]|uniref:Conserved hypothetical tiny transmembrane protein n=1 Tax=Evansella caseinilytica TaxID=1503961 RepID=A0A1H3PQB6_9BACI|nr:YjcZ family sporulation protein [Evansella caseinilytica]SDZ03246.1 conserved hypothetical tiny transmembrane protein [Evansella caseinilytica]
MGDYYGYDYAGYGHDPYAAYACAPTAPAVAPARGFGAGFALILVLFILLVIIGAALAW